MFAEKGWKIGALAGLGLAFGAVGSANATLLVYEGFQYSNVGDDLDAVTTVDVDATGLTGVWTENLNNTEMFIKAGSLAFSDLATTGNHIGYLSNQNNDIFTRDLDATAASGVASASTLYFSFLFEKLQNNFGADHEGLALMNGILPSSRFDSGNPGAIGRHGFAIANVDGINGSDLQAVAYDGTTGTQVVGETPLPITVVNGSSNTDTSNQAVNFIVGEISFNTGTGGADVFNLYSVTDDGSLGADDLVLIDTIEADVDESTLTTLNITRQVNVNYDEIRIGDTLEDVLGGEGGPTLPGDTDGDGDVDDSDLGTSFSNYTGPVGDVGKTAADGDVDGDGDVDDSDLGTSFSNYTGPIAVNVPEPTSLALLGLGGLLGARRRRG